MSENNTSFSDIQGVPVMKVQVRADDDEEARGGSGVSLTWGAEINRMLARHAQPSRLLAITGEIVQSRPTLQ